MPDKNREHRRISKPVTLQFCIADANPKRWDMSIVENISAGGIKFLAPIDVKLADKIVQVQIKIPELAPLWLELEAVVLSVTPRSNGKSSDIRAKFINLKEEDKGHLLIVEKIIQAQENRDSDRILWENRKFWLEE